MNAFNLKHYGLLVITSLLIIACSSPSTENATKPEVSNLISDSIPFELTAYNNLLIDGLFNQEDTLALMFHLASESVSITTEGMEKAKSVQWDHSATVSSWGGSGEAKYSAQNQLQIGKSTFDSLGITESKRSGHFSDGKIGYTYWNDKVMHIDFETSQMLLYDTLLQVPDGYDKMEIEIVDNFIYVKGKLTVGDTSLDHSFLLHSGYSGIAMLDDAFVEKHQINEKLETIKESSLEDSNGNKLITKTLSAPKFSLGAFEFDAVPISSFAGKLKRQSFSVLGGDALKRFNIIFDFPKQTIYFKPNKKFGGAYYEKVG